jgi:phosphohistidine phosphatase
MQLYIMRHGQANPVGNIDHLRELTPTGYNEAQCMGKWFHQQGLPFVHVFVSPYVRAQQTANTVLDEINGQVKRETINFITPLDDAKKVHDYLDGVCADSDIEHLLIVSHMPLVSYLVETLTADHQSPIFQTAAIAQIDYDVKKMTGNLVQLISPADLA